MDAGVPIKRAGRGHRDGPDQGGRRLHRPHRHRRRRGPPRRHGLQGRRHRATGITALQMDIKITGVTFDILRDALDAGQARPACTSSARCTRPSTRRATELSPYAPRILTVKIDPRQDRPAHRQGRRDHPRPAGGVRVPDRRQRRGPGARLLANGELGDALAERIRTMTKEVEVGDEFTGKVVKTTTFGAFVELAKGTDGLLHISNIAPGRARRRRSRRSSTRATRSRSAWSRSTASAAASACAWPTTRTSPARPTRSSPRSAPAAATAAARAATAAVARRR